MKLKSAGMFVRAGIVVIGGLAVVLTAAENFSAARNTEALTLPVTVLNSSSKSTETTSESRSVSPEISSVQVSVMPQSSSSVSTEVKVEPPVSSDDPINSAPLENSVSEVPQPEESILPVSSIFSSTADEYISSVSISSVPDIPDRTFSSSEKPPVSSSTNSVSSIGSSVYEPPVVSTIIQSSSIPEPAASSEPVQSSIPENNEPETVNINTATSEELQELWGIGADKADAIISYRENFGDFTDIHDIRRVDGIGDVVFEGISDHITV